MGQRVNDLADRFESANNDVIAAVQGCSDDQWQRTTNSEGWSVGVVAHHIATSNEPIAGLIRLVATGQPLPNLTRDMIDAGNAQHAHEQANCTREETLALLKSGGEAAASILRGLSDEQLDRSAPLPLVGGKEMSANQLVEMVLIGHPVQHLESINSALG
jgi:uncharacterized damage-inducible protein DinB